jgi:hypothetical protein
MTRERMIRALTAALLEAYRKAAQRGYRGTYFLRMLDERDAIDTVIALVMSGTPSSGFTEMWRLHMLQWTVREHRHRRMGPVGQAVR